MKEHLRFFVISTTSLVIILLLTMIDKIHFASEKVQVFYQAFGDTFSFSLTFAMIAAWGISVIRRVMQPQVKRYLILSALAMSFWLIVREIKWQYVSSALVTSWLWYLYYIPMVLIPVYGFFASMYLGKDSDFKLNPRWHGVYFAATFLIFMVLTNNRHEKVFKFNNFTSQEVGDYSYGIGYYVIVMWIVVFISLFIITAEKRCNQNAVGMKRYMPFSVLILGLVYGVGYINSPKLSWFPDVDIMLAYDWLTIMMWETCIELGLITVNSYYREFFKRSSIGAQITDYEGRPYISAHNAIELPKDAFDILLTNGTYQYNLATRLHIYPSSCGYTIWQEDVSTVNGMIETLKEMREDLKEGNTLAEQEMQAEVRKKKTEEATRIYTLLSRSMEDELSIINGMTRSILKSDNPETIRQLMASINFEGVYLKRKGNFIMIAETRNTIPWEEVELALMEMEKNLKLCNMQFSYKVDINRELDRKELLAAFEAIEALVGARLFKTNAMFVKLDSDSQGLNMLIKQPEIRDMRFSFERGEIENA